METYTLQKQNLLFPRMGSRGADLTFRFHFHSYIHSINIK